MKTSAFDTQVGGGHYKDLPIQPAEYCQRNRLGFMESCVVKYVTRHRDKHGVEDLQKARQFIDMLIELEYPDADQKSGGRWFTWRWFKRT